MKKRGYISIGITLYTLTLICLNCCIFSYRVNALVITNPREKSNIELQQKYPETLILKGASEENKIALTFDDGPDPKSTPYILDALARYDIKATFFVLGANAKKYPDIVRRIDKDGHIIGNHTNSHLILVNHNRNVIENEILITENIVNEIIGYRPALFRAPYGALNEEAIDILKQLDNTVVGWSVDSLDWWKSKSLAEVAVNVLSDSDSGSIILFHDLRKNVAILHQIIPAMQEKGMEFVTVTELINVSKSKNSSDNIKNYSNYFIID